MNHRQGLYPARVLAAAIVLGCTAASAQSNAPAAAPGGNVYGFVNAIHVVNNVDKTIEFYRAVYGMQVKSQDKMAVEDAALNKLFGVSGAKIRRAVMSIPGASFGVELIEFAGVPHSQAKLRKQDFASTNLNYRVRDIDPLWLAAKKAGAEPITAGGDSLLQENNNNTTSRLYFHFDPDFIVDEMTEPQGEGPATPGNNVVSASVAMVSSDAVKLAKFYNALGITFKPGEFQAWTPLREKLTGTGHVTLRSTTASIAGAQDRWSVFEYGGSDGKKFQNKIQDPGVSMFSLRVRDAAAAAKAAVAGGGSKNAGRPTGKLADGSSAVVVSDPDGFFLVLMQ